MDEHKHPIASFSFYGDGTDHAEDAEFIVRACNSHYELLEALEICRAELRNHCITEIGDICFVAKEAVYVADKVISKAEGKVKL